MCIYIYYNVICSISVWLDVIYSYLISLILTCLSHWKAHKSYHQPGESLPIPLGKLPRTSSASSPKMMAATCSCCLDPRCCPHLPKGLPEPVGWQKVKHFFIMFIYFHIFLGEQKHHWSVVLKSQFLLISGVQGLDWSMNLWTCWFVGWFIVVTTCDIYTLMNAWKFRLLAVSRELSHL